MRLPQTGNFPLTAELDQSERTTLASLTMNILEEWRIAPEDQLKLLGFPEDTKPRHLSKYKNGEPFPDDENILKHAKHLLGIQESLHIVFALNRNMPSFWLKNRNKVLKGIPLQIMLDEGLGGMFRVWRYLDCTVNWD
jgi:hypothetical protein